ncbi:MAG: hypothetical protein RIT45_1470 [Pseudomonadota bacterium]|jgi:hypothetical protein
MLFRRSLALVAMLLFSTAAWAQPAAAPPPAQPLPPEMAPPPEAAAFGVNSVNLSPLGVLFGSYSLNFEHLVDGYHGLLVEGQFSQSSDENSSSTGIGGGLGYRYHWSGTQDSGFVGAMVAYQAGTAVATVNSQTFDISVGAASFTANIGRRWAWTSGFNVTLRFGVGRAIYDITSTSTDPDVQQAIDQVDSLMNALPVAFDGELSIGWIF